MHFYHFSVQNAIRIIPLFKLKAAIVFVCAITILKTTTEKMLF